MSLLRVGLCTGPGAVASTQRLAGADILVFPEMVDSGYAALKAGAAPHRTGDELLSGFASASRSLAPYCIAGSVYLRQPPPLTSNTSLVYCRGRLVHRYDKIHLFRPAGDHRYFRPGTRIGTFPLTIPGARIRCGVIICYDLRFPELVRAMARERPAVLFVPARWPAARDDHWRTLLKARAIENQMFVVGCNAYGEEGGWSYVFDPLGETVFDGHAEPGEQAYLVPLDLGRIAEAHRLHRNLNEAVVLRSAKLPRTVTARRGRGG
ncbi:MAG TPA: nitrilase-related carbon-nitrogen hydrolase [Bacteroidota bacterium]|nr:nitrilase-related carbon-nitrogen hydrolase [Bacteroidota bacterium]